jgi:beta-galactosidase beta subunit
MLAVILSREDVKSDRIMKARIEVSLREAENQIVRSHSKWFEVRNRKEEQRETERATKEPKYRRREEEEEEEDDDESVSPRGRQRTLKLTYNELRPEAAHEKLTQMPFKRCCEYAGA